MNKSNWASKNTDNIYFYVMLVYKLEICILLLFFHKKLPNVFCNAFQIIQQVIFYNLFVAGKQSTAAFALNMAEIDIGVNQAPVFPMDCILGDTLNCLP